MLRNHKREGLILFPRVGRSDSKTSALWFGPRLGKSIRMPENYDEYLQDAGKIHKYMFGIPKFTNINLLFIASKENNLLTIKLH